MGGQYGDQPGGQPPQGGWDQGQPPPGQGQPPTWQPPPPPGQPQPWQGQQPYGQEDHPRTILAFVLSLVGVTVCAPVAIVSLIFGREAQRDMRAQPGRYKNEGLATAAVVISWIAIALLALAILFFIIVFGILGATAGFST